MKSAVDVIIVNWNGGSYLKDAIKSLNDIEDYKYVNKIIIVDNNSSDNSLQLVNDHLKNQKNDFNVEFVLNKENLGFAKSCNLGAKMSTSKYLLFLNPDTLLYPGSLKAPIDFLENPTNDNYALCGIKLVDEHKFATRTSARIPLFSNFVYSGLGLDMIAPSKFPGVLNKDWDHNESRDIDHVIGAFYFIRSEVFNEVEGFDDNFFLYYEDLDLSKRIKDSGYKIRYLAEVQAMHQGGGCSEQIKTLRLSFSNRSKVYYIKKHFSRVPSFLLQLILFIVEPFQRFFYYLAKGSLTDAYHSVAGHSHFLYTMLLNDGDQERADKNIDITNYSPGVAALGYSSIIVAFITLAGRVLSVYRDRLLALHLGASLTVDSFFLLLSICQFVSSIFATSAINYYLPTLHKSTDSLKAYEINIRLSTTWFVVTFILGAILAFAFDYSLLIVAITSFCFFFLSMNNLQAALLNRHNSFIKPTLTFVIPVIATIIPILLNKSDLNLLLSSFLIGNILQLITLNLLASTSERHQNPLKAYWQSIRSTSTLEPWSKFILTWTPLLLATIHFPISEIMNFLLAKSFGDGSVSQMGYAMRIPFAIANIMTYSIWTVLLPQISIDHFLPKVRKSSFIFISFLALGAAFSWVLLKINPMLVEFIYGRGSSLTSSEIGQIILIQSIFIMAFPFQLFVNIFLRFLHSLRQTIPTLIISFCGISSMFIYFYFFDHSLVGVARSFLVNTVTTSVLLILYWILKSFIDQVKVKRLNDKNYVTIHKSTNNNTLNIKGGSHEFC